MSANAVTWLRAALGGRYEPFPWQVRLLENLLAEPTPRALDLPTGLGKTSVMAIWLVARACGARHLPRRLVYVVDRRAVVHQATRVAEELRAWVAGDEEVRAALGLVHEFPISTLRGQFVENAIPFFSVEQAHLVDSAESAS
ncbi:MAG: DEAD/DEAH box helicase family protein [Alphaproteobacteria bacterium]|nr:DEAD/DEAH box helicase family protein [Alphaproteobacteria bacterium]